ncbi:MAG: LemA family protein [Firmicutes bacterium]|jgi:LemA protein|nr:LemA family protein [Bacillota bacterium]
MKRSWIIVVAAILVLAFGLISQYNSLVSLETNVDARWAQVENQLQRRADLIPNLVNTVKGYASHEEQIFTEIAAARSRLLSAASPSAQMEASNSLDMALGRLLAIAENYPQLKADTSFVRLQDELAGTENRIAVERMRYNEAVQEWNRTIRRFPTVLVARLFGKDVRPFFEASAGAQEVPQVQF